MAHPNTRITNFTNRTITVTPVVSTSAYAAGDVLFAATELDFGNALVSGIIKHVSILDVADTAAQTITLYFAGETITLATAVNDALNISDGDAAKLIGTANVTTSVDLANSRFGQNTDIGLPFSVNNGSLWVGATTAGTPTFAAATDLKLRVTIEVHAEN
jgi:hypothetical protein